MQLERLLFVLLFTILALTFVFEEKLGVIVSYIKTQDIALFLFTNFTFAILAVGFVLFASILGALYLVSEVR